ncbi:hypothetical protein [Phyllobacterium leguminum]|uniref:Uncharacterized protein n=1 Tax=Phyllobacterium leguminum TaxID=314237 RepID=A0A318SYU9_9HYPH|nr:hypothetical protein [Phyllobacterium leguminum]PYE86665.1 hypothetical protein C7477_12130 [Phyllobacterium leguminum]
MPIKTLPDTMVSPVTGETLRRGVRPFAVSYKGRSVTVQLPGYYPDHGDDGVLVGDDMAVTDAALRTLKDQAEGAGFPTERRHDREYTLEELGQLIDESRKSGISTQSVDEIFAEAERIFAARYGGQPRKS